MFLRTGIVMTPERDGVAAAPCGLDNTTFDVTGDGTNAEQYFVMAPAASTSFNYPGYTNPGDVIDDETVLVELVEVHHGR